MVFHRSCESAKTFYWLCLSISGRLSSLVAAHALIIKLVTHCASGSKCRSLIGSRGQVTPTLVATLFFFSRFLPVRNGGICRVAVECVSPEKSHAIFTDFSVSDQRIENHRTFPFLEITDTKIGVRVSVATSKELHRVVGPEHLHGVNFNSNHSGILTKKNERNGGASVTSFDFFSR